MDFLYFPKIFNKITTFRYFPMTGNISHFSKNPDKSIIQCDLLWHEKTFLIFFPLERQNQVHFKVYVQFIFI